MTMTMTCLSTGRIVTKGDDAGDCMMRWLDLPNRDELELPEGTIVLDGDLSEPEARIATKRHRQELCDAIVGQQLAEVRADRAAREAEAELPHVSVPRGELLPNGARCIDYAVTGDTVTVLALWGDQYVTWRHAAGFPEGTGSGRYFADIVEAAADFDARS